MICHFIGQPIPIWVIVEILSFGTISKMFANLKPPLRKAISNSNDYENKYKEYVFSNNLQMVCNLRNICAHHGRLYGKVFPYNVKLSNKDISLFNRYGIATPNNSASTPFHLIFALCNLIYSKKETIRFIKRLKHLFFRYRHYIDVSSLGFYRNWSKLLKK